MFAYCQSNMVVTGSNTNWNENYSANKHPLSENKICVMWFYLYDWLKTINKPISHNIHPRQLFIYMPKVCDDTIKVRCCSICSYLNEFDFPFEKKIETFTREFESIFLNLLYIFHSQRKLSLVDNGKISSRTIHMLDYKQIRTMECAYLNWAAEHNFGINNANHVQLFEYLCVLLKCKLMTCD